MSSLVEMQQEMFGEIAKFSWARGEYNIKDRKNYEGGNKAYYAGRHGLLRRPSYRLFSMDDSDWKKSRSGKGAKVKLYVGDLNPADARKVHRAYKAGKETVNMNGVVYEINRNGTSIAR